MKRKLLAVAVCCLFVTAAQASTTTDPAVGNAKAEIITAVELDHDGAATLNFGRMIVTSAGTVVVPATSGTGIATYTGASEASGGDATMADHFTVTGLTSGVTYNVNLPGSITLDHATDATKHMTVDTLTKSVSDGSSAGEFYVGGTLHFTADQAAGVYTGNYNVTITY